MKTIAPALGQGVTVRDHSMDGMELFVIDDFVPARVRDSFARKVNRFPYHRLQGDTQESKKTYNYYAAHLNRHSVRAEKLTLAMLTTIERCFPREKLALQNAYINRVDFGDATFAHYDYKPASARHVSAVYFANERWETDWAGETIFFDADYDARVAVSPRPGRLSVFRGNIRHRIGVPSRLCTVSRLTVVMKFNATPIS